MHLIDKYAYESKFRYVSITKKSILALATIIFVAFASSMLNVIVFILAFALILVSGVSFKKLISLLTIPLTFLLIGLLGVIIEFNAQSYIVASKLFGVSFGITGSSLERSTVILFRTIATVSTVYAFILTTTINDIIKGLAKLRLPKDLIELIVLVYRFIFIFIEEAMQLNLSANLKLGNISFSKRINTISRLIGVLFFSTFKRYRIMSESLELKLYDGDFVKGVSDVKTR